MPSPIYNAQDLKAFFHLRYAWTGWPTKGTKLATQPDDLFFQELDDAWATGNLNRISMRWNDDDSDWFVESGGQAFATTQ